MKLEYLSPQKCWELSAHDRNEYHRLQLLKLLSWASDQVPFYRKLNLSFDILQKASLEEILNSLPIVTKDMLRGRNPDFLASTPMPGYWSKTGGSTGEPTELFYDRAKVRWGKQSAEFARNWWGLRSGQRCFYVWGHSASLAQGWAGRKNRILQPIKDALRNRLRINAYRMDQDSLKRYVRQLIDFQPKMIIGYTSTIYLLAQKFKDDGFKASALPKLLGVIVTADPCYPFQAETIRSAFDVPVIEEYGSAETGVIAYSHPDGTFRILEDRLIVETPLSSNEMPEILVTDLSTRFQPLIRFAMADQSQSPITIPPNKQGFRLLGKVEGRVLDSVHGDNGQRLHGVALSHIMHGIYPGSLRYRFHQSANGSLNIELQLKPTVSKSSESEHQLIAYLQNQLGSSISIKIVYVDNFPPSLSGKFRWVISENLPGHLEQNSSQENN